MEPVEEEADEVYLPSLIKTVQTLIFFFGGGKGGLDYENLGEFLHEKKKMHVLYAKDSFPFAIFQVPSPQQEGFNDSQYNG